jgi:bifunctional UDP-N-acetylglucosamine pyrophosphorylase/glucosamine-1-phosphate N-acetyltransferase
MKSDLHKVLHPLAGRPMLEHLLAGVEELGCHRSVVVVGSGREQVEPLVAAHGGTVAVQEPQLGTAHAVQQAQAALACYDADVLILYGDTPLVSVATMRGNGGAAARRDAPAVVVVAFRPDDPLRYGA